MSIQIKKASRSRVYLKLAFTGPSGSGKSHSSLQVARGLVGPEGKIGAIDSENGSLSLYAHVTDFDVYDLVDFAPESYVAAIQAFEAAGYDVLIIDSISHAWKYILEQKAALDARGGNGMMNWKGPKERYAKLTQAVLQSKMHIIGNMRAKTEYVENEGKKGYSKAGLAAVAEPDSEFEYTVVFSMGMDHRALAGVEGQGKDRTDMFSTKGAFVPSEATGVMLREWLNGATNQEFAAPKAATVAPVAAPATGISATAAYLRDVIKMTPDDLKTYRELCTGNGLDSKLVTPVLMRVEVQNMDGVRDAVALMVGLRDLGVEPTEDNVAQFNDAVPAGIQRLNVIDQATEFGVTELAALCDYAKTFDETPAVDDKKTGGSKKATQAKPAEAAA